MSVHIDELHTEVVPAGGAAPGGGAGGPDREPVGVTQERWAANRAQAEAIRARTAAEGFDD